MTRLAFFLPLWMGSLLLALLAGPVGSLLIWTGTPVLAESIGHAALLGFALHFQWPWISSELGVLITAWAMALLLFQAQRSFQPAMAETLLQQTSAAALALGLAYLYHMPSAWGQWARVGLGDMMALDLYSLLPLSGGCFLFLLWLYCSLRPVLACFLDPEVAALEGRRVTLWRLTTLLVLSSATALLVVHFGSLLVTSILLAPATAAHRWARSPAQNMALASFLSFCALILATSVTSLWVDAPIPCFLALQNFLLLVVPSLQGPRN